MFSVEPQGAVDVVKAMTPLDEDNLGTFQETIESGLSAGQPMVVFDMSEVPLMDSAGLEALLDFQDAMQDRGGMVKLAAVGQLCQEILRVTGVEQHFDSFQDVKTAVGSYVQ